MENNTHYFGTLAQTDAAQTNRVLRNTYALLGLTMVPTVIGAVLGTQFMMPLFLAMGFMVTGLVFLGVCFGLFYAIQKNRDSSLGVAFLLLLTLFMGAMLGPILSAALSLRNGGQLIALAAGGTGAIFFTLAGIAATTKRDFSGMGKTLTIGAVVLLVCALANMFLQIPAMALAISAVSILIFSGFIMYDINRIVHGGETNYVIATLGVYLSIYNIFQSLLHLLMAFLGDRE